VVALARDMIEAPQPVSCRRGAEVLGASRHSIWRWRMKIIGALTPEADDSLAGIVEADEAQAREGRPGARQGGPHRGAPAKHPAPPHAPALARLQAPWGLMHSASRGMAGLGEEDPRGN